MKKNELMVEIQNIIDELDMSAKDFGDLHNIRSEYDVWAYRTGWCNASLKILLVRVLTEEIINDWPHS